MLSQIVVRRNTSVYSLVMPLDQRTAKKIGQRIREARQDRKLSQEQLAVFGVSESGTHGDMGLRES